MGEWLTDLVLPRTDAGVMAQLVGLGAVTVVALAVVWREPALRLLVVGVALVVLAGFGLRALH